MLGALQARTDDDFRDEEPGKILHELRLGELTAFEERPHSPYYGSADSTPLFLILLDEYERWTRRRASWSQRSSARRAPRSAGSTSTATATATATSSTSAATRRPASRTSAGRTLELDRVRRRHARAAAARDLRDPGLRLRRQGPHRAAGARGSGTTRSGPTQLEQQAAELKERFNRDFWIEERGFFALALDGKKRKVDSLTSNIGHLLWSGIVDDDKAEPLRRST